MTSVPSSVFFHLRCYLHLLFPPPLTSIPSSSPVDYICGYISNVPTRAPATSLFIIISCLIPSILLLWFSAECSLENVNQTISEQYTCSQNTSVASHQLRIKFSIPQVAPRAWQETASVCFCNRSSGTFLSCSLPCSHTGLFFQVRTAQHSVPPRALARSSQLITSFLYILLVLT